jgi:AcrR family transcriptional regulator
MKAIIHLAQKGIESTNMDDIAAAAEYTRRTLYAYFKSRDDICLRVHLEDMTRRWELQKQALDGIEGGLARIGAWAERLYAFWRENPHSMRMEQYWDFHGVERDRISADVFSRFETLNDELADGLREMFHVGIEDGSLRPDLPVDVCISQFVYSLRAVLGRALSPSYSFADIDPDQYVRHYLDLFQRSVRNEDRRRES